jgi:uncharacterized protein HemY
VLETIHTLSEQTSNIIDVIRAAQEEEFRVHDRSHNSNLIQERCQVTVEDINKLYDLGRLHYEIGKFDEAAQILEDFRRVVRSHILSVLCPIEFSCGIYFKFKN